MPPIPKKLLLLLTLLLPSCSPVPKPAPSPLASTNPTFLLSLLANPNTPEPSRTAADAQLVQLTSKTNPTRLALLEQLLYAPGHSTTIRIYALDQLADADPVRATNALILYLPQFTDPQLLAHACSLALTLDSPKLVDPLVRSLDQPSNSPLNSRPEFATLEKLTAAPLPQTLLHLLATSNNQSLRIASLDLLQQLLPPAQLLSQIQSLHPEVSDQYLSDLQWYLTQFQTPPKGETESSWMRLFHQPENKPLISLAHQHHLQQLAFPDYHFNPRSLITLAAASPEDLATPTPALLSSLPPSISPAAKNLSRLDLLTLRLLLQNYTSGPILHYLQSLGQKNTPTPPNPLTLVQYLFHFQKIRNPNPSLPTPQELQSAQQNNLNSLLITSTSPTQISLTFFTPSPTIIPLGTFQIP